MLHYFRIRNYKSILETEVNMSYGENKAPNNYKTFNYFPFFENNKKERLIPFLALYGANASGKSNIISAFSTFQELIKSEINSTLFIPNRICDKCDTTEFTIKYNYLDKDYEYTIEYNSQSIIKEHLICNQKSIFKIDSTTIKPIFKINIYEDLFYNSMRLQKIYETECCNELRLQTSSFMKKLATAYSGLNFDLTNAYKYIIDSLYILDSNTISPEDSINILAKNNNKEEIELAIEKIFTTLKALDIGISNYSYDSTKNKNITNLKLAHKNINKQDEYFPIKEESLGTNILFGLLGYIFKVIENGGVLIVDEFDKSIHSLLFYKLINLFLSKDSNKNKAQLIFTAHNTDLMDTDLPRVSEIGIIEKTIKKGTIINRLCDFDNIRNVTNFRKQYLLGTFSGIPFPYL